MKYSYKKTLVIQYDQQTREKALKSFQLLNPRQAHKINCPVKYNYMDT